jgi:hypothetical protein
MRNLELAGGAQLLVSCYNLLGHRPEHETESDQASKNGWFQCNPSNVNVIFLYEVSLGKCVDLGGRVWNRPHVGVISSSRYKFVFIP